MNNLSVDDLFTLKPTLEAQLKNEFRQGPTAESLGTFDFLIGEWRLERTSFDKGGSILSRAVGNVCARYTFDGRVIQEDFYNDSEDGSTFRAGTALYTFRPATEQWHVAALDASTGATSYQPRLVANEVHYETVIQLQQTTVFTKNRIFNITSNASEWEQMISTDRTGWFRNYHIVHTRAN